MNPLACYNTITALPSVLSELDLSFAIQNSALTRIASRVMRTVNQPNMRTLNSIVAQAVEATTANMRTDGCLHNTLDELIGDLVPRRDIPLATISYSPFVGANDKFVPELADLTEATFLQQNCLADVSLEQGVFSTCCMHFRGE